MLNVLFVGGGRRVSLAKRFKRAGCNLFSYETETKCPVSEYANIIEGRRWADSEIGGHLIAAMGRYDVQLAIPLQDHATVVLSRIKDNNQTAARIPTASSAINDICLNKKKFADKLKDCDIYPKPIPSENVIIKPIFGFGSKGIQKLSYDEFKNNETDLLLNNVAQRFIEGIEYSVDAYFNRDGKMVDAVPRRRLEVQGGEVSRSITVPRGQYNLHNLTRILGENIGLVGPACVQFIVNKDGIPFIMEVNSRFGGGVILSLEAGFDMIDLILKEYVHDMYVGPRNFDWKYNFGMTRYFQEYFYE